jgi:hypothetical protein
MSKVILPIAAALAALSTAAASDKASATAPQEADVTTTVPAAVPVRAGQPNMLVTAGEDLLGLVVSKNEDGTVVADHYSHVSHGSHGSHTSHYSSRY